MLVIGLMSGTSLDGIDAVLVEFSGATEAEVAWRVVGFVSRPYSPEERERIHRVILDGGAEALCRLHGELGEWLAAAALQVCEASMVDAAQVGLVGSHGQTVWHIPPLPGKRGYTLQLGDPATIAERTGIPVVSDFRARDVAAGGEGAPLVPWQDRVLFSAPGKARVLQNIGGMGNLTWIPPKGEELPLLAFDTGPGNALIDAAVELATGGRETFDRDGERAARGHVDEELVRRALSHSFFMLTPPKSTGRELFGRPFVEDLVRNLRPVSDAGWDDVIASLTAVTARSIVDAIREWVLHRGVDEVVISGGGARNPVLVRMVRDALAPIPVVTGEALGIDPDAKEAIAFAGLAWAFVHGIPGSVPEATGALGPRILGSLTPGAGGRLPTPTNAST
ncbi:MAG TPA: anhydro-N-acetylmuramic acid kinase [Longimicrobiales bacterium]|nr:anhydro-N-acetylmuramic acid kinase [Longimicrobiales bacterium]